jgi:TM2 domain-containing membrane protein YozV
MKSLKIKKLLLGLAAVSVVCAMPALKAYGQNGAITPETVEATTTAEATEAAATVAITAPDASVVETGLAFEGFNFYDPTFAQTGALAYRRKSPFLAWFLSWLYPGVGQFYNGSVGKGVTMTALATGGLGCLYAGVIDFDNGGEGDLIGVGLLVYLGASVWSMIDAPISAARINRRNAALTWNVGDAQLKLRPDISYENPVKGLQLRKELYCGMSVRMEF